LVSTRTRFEAFVGEVQLLHAERTHFLLVIVIDELIL
jgi:hypothetical protein